MMRIQDTEAELEQMLLDRGLDLDRLDPWDTWRVFASFLRREVLCDHDTASVQGRRKRAIDQPTVYDLTFIRQMAFVEAGRVVPVRQVVVDIRVGVGADERIGAFELWSDDFSNLEEFIDAVEGSESFRRVTNGDVDESEIFSEEC